MTARVSIVIKALNEERHVEAAVSSALRALSGLEGRVILADSGSTDGTIRIAQRFAIDIVQLADVGERCCGIGAQLGYQFADGDYVYILDGDMELLPEFLPAALARMAAQPTLAGVGGLVEELGGGNYEFEVRKSVHDGRVTGDQDCLDMGGLYRMEAVRRVGYLTNRNLHSYEEKELGWRLRQAGWRLERLAIPAVRHHGKSEDSWSLLHKRWRSRHIDGPGEWTRAASTARQSLQVALKFKQLWAIAFSWPALAVSLAALPWTVRPLALMLTLNALLFVRLLAKRRSVAMAWMGFIHLQVYAAGMIRGLLAPQRPPDDPIDAVVIQQTTRGSP